MAPARPRVLLVTPWAPTPYDGGSRRILTLARLLSGRFRFSLLTTEPLLDRRAAAAQELGREGWSLRALFEEIERVPLTDVPLDPSLPDDVARWRLPALDAAVKRLSGRFDLVHCEYEMTALSAEGLRGVPRVLTLHDLGDFRREDHRAPPEERRAARA